MQLNIAHEVLSLFCVHTQVAGAMDIQCVV